MQILGWPCVVMGIFGNILVIATVATQRSLRRKHFMFVSSMAIADLIVSGYVVPIWLVAVATGRYPAVNDEHCIINALLMLLGVFASVYTLILIAFNRYLLVCKPDRYSKVFTKKTSILFCSLPWVIPGTMCIVMLGVDPDHFRYSSTSNSCGALARAEGHESVEKISEIASLCMPPFVVGFFSHKIFQRWRKSKKIVDSAMQSSHAKFSREEVRPHPGLLHPSSASTHTQQGLLRPSTSTQEASQEIYQGKFSVSATSLSSVGSRGKSEPTVAPDTRHVTRTEMAFIRTLVPISVLLVVTYTPVAVCIALAEDVSADVMQLSLLVCFANSSINWIIYGMLSVQFRQAYKRMFRSHKVMGCLHACCPGLMKP
jgi:hypothetical protein